MQHSLSSLSIDTEAASIGQHAGGLYGAPPAQQPPRSGLPVYIETNRRRNSVGDRTAPALPQLIYVNEEDREQRFTLDKEVNTIGRKEGNDIILNFINVSKQHAIVERTDAGYNNCGSSLYI
jgi:hypothetical protein